MKSKTHKCRSRLLFDDFVVVSIRQCNLVVSEAAKPGDTHMSDMQDVFVNFSTSIISVTHKNPRSFPSIVLD